MGRRLRTERRYPIRDFAYIHLEDEIDSIPDELAFDNEFTKNARFLQLINMELAYRHYLQIAKRAPHSMALDEAINILEELRLETLKTLKEIRNGEIENDGADPAD